MYSNECLVVHSRIVCRFEPHRATMVMQRQWFQSIVQLCGFVSVFCFAFNIPAQCFLCAHMCYSLARSLTLLVCVSVFVCTGPDYNSCRVFTIQWNCNQCTREERNWITIFRPNIEPRSRFYCGDKRWHLFYWRRITKFGIETICALHPKYYTSYASFRLHTHLVTFPHNERENESKKQQQ